MNQFSFLGCIMPQVNISKLKTLMKRKFPEGSVLRDLILKEKDILTYEEYLAKASIWLEIETRER